MDRFDRQLLNLVQKDSSQTAEQLSKRISLSPSAIQRRLRKLRDTGVIVRETAVLDPRRVGRPTFFLVSIEVERERPELLARLRSWLHDHDAIQQAFYVTGGADFIIILTAPDVDAFDALMSEMVSENSNIRRFTTNVALSLIKRGLTIPVNIE